MIQIIFYVICWSVKNLTFQRHFFKSFILEGSDLNIYFDKISNAITYIVFQLAQI